MKVIAWILFILTSLDALKMFADVLLGDSAGKRFFALFQMLVRALGIYVLVDFLFLSHAVVPWMAITVAVLNGIIALSSLCEDEFADRICGIVVRGLYCVGFILLI